MEVNKYYLELIFILLNNFQQQKLIKKVILREILSLKKKDKKYQKKKLNCKFIRVNTSKENYDADYKLVEYRCLSVSLKTKKNKHEIKALKDEIKK